MREKIIKLIAYAITPIVIIYQLLLVLIVGIGVLIKIIGFLLEGGFREIECEWKDYVDYIRGYRRLF
ncbi:hypothetical protein AAA162_12560 [Parabacteroides johnsonii]|uniref:hypothetical protein n=1 Tax=Parabacteroides johnsonii TaxID=387661 RepID=UPI0032BF98A6